MKTVCPSYLHPPNHAQRTASLPAKSCRIRLLSAFHKEPLFRTSQIVPDRLRSSQIVRDRPSAPPPIARHSRRIAAMFARFRPPNRQKSASKRVGSRQNTPRRVRGKKQCSISPDHTEVHPTWHDRTCRQTVKKRPSTPTRSASTSVGRNFFGATFGDIWGHLGTYVPIARPAPPGNALPGAYRKSAPDSEPHRHPPRPERKPAAQLEHLAVHPRQQPIVPRRLQRRLRHAHPVRHSPLPKVEVHEILRSCAERERAPCWNGYCSWSILFAQRTTRQWRKSTRCDKDVAR